MEFQSLSSSNLSTIAAISKWQSIKSIHGKNQVLDYIFFSFKKSIISVFITIGNNKQSQQAIFHLMPALKIPVSALTLATLKYSNQN